MPKTALVDASAKTVERDPMHGAELNTATAENFIAEKRIGERIKRLRLKRSMGLVELGRHTGLSASFLSQLETGRVVPTLKNLARIAMVFSKDLSYFFESAPESVFRLHRRRERIRMPQTGVEDPTYYFESLGYNVADRLMDPYLAEFIPLKPGQEPRAHLHPGYEFFYLIEGSILIHHGEQEFELGPGDTAYFDAATAHSYRCAGRDAAQAIIVTMAQVPSASSAQRPTAQLVPKANAQVNPVAPLKS